MDFNYDIVPSGAQYVAVRLSPTESLEGPRMRRMFKYALGTDSLVFHRGFRRR